MYEQQLWNTLLSRISPPSHSGKNSWEWGNDCSYGTKLTYSHIFKLTSLYTQENETLHLVWDLNTFMWKAKKRVHYL